MIRFDQASKQYPDGTVAVDDLELEAPTGQITVLVGPSGCGKTTSLRMVNRMIEPTSGTIWLDDTDTASMPAHELRRAGFKVRVRDVGKSGRVFAQFPMGQAPAGSRITIWH